MILTLERIKDDPTGTYPPVLFVAVETSEAKHRRASKEYNVVPCPHGSKRSRCRFCKTTARKEYERQRAFLNLWKSLPTHEQEKARETLEPDGLTVGQRRVLHGLHSLLHSRQGVLPTAKEVAIAAGYKDSRDINQQLFALEKKGLLQRTFGVTRSLTLTDAGRAYVQVNPPS